MRNRRRGLSLLEVMIAMAILAMLANMLYYALFKSSEQYKIDMGTASILEKARGAMDEMARELRTADRATVLLDTFNGASRLRFNACLGVDGAGNAIWSSQITYQFVADPLLDANNNGIVDEGLVQRLQVGTADRLFCNYVVGAPNGFIVTRPAIGNQTSLTLSLTLVVTDERNRPLTRVITTTIDMRNFST